MLTYKIKLLLLYVVVVVVVVVVVAMRHGLAYIDGLHFRKSGEGRGGEGMVPY